MQQIYKLAKSPPGNCDLNIPTEAFTNWKADPKEPESCFGFGR